jgi:hypothetical protein
MASAGTTPFYRREHELQRLQELAGKKTASLVIIKGRRRIGKSRLATELARRECPRFGLAVADSHRTRPSSLLLDRGVVTGNQLPLAIGHLHPGIGPAQVLVERLTRIRAFSLVTAGRDCDIAVVAILCRLAEVATINATCYTYYCGDT